MNEECYKTVPGSITPYNILYKAEHTNCSKTLNIILMMFSSTSFTMHIKLGTKFNNAKLILKVQE